MKEKVLSGFAVVANLLNRGHERSAKAKKNILASFFIKGVSIAISIVMVRLTLNYVNPSRYGIWLTLSSIVAWFSFFDIGLTQGLRNKFAEAKANGNSELARSYISTTYAVLSIIFLSLLALFFAGNQFLNWASILNVSQELRGEISILAMITFTYFCLQFILRIISTIVIADQQPAKASVIDVVGQLISLVFVFILVKTTQGSLVRLGIALTAAPLLALVGATVILFTGKYRIYRPSFKRVDFSHARKLLNLGVVFFIIQVAGVIQLQTANIIIARTFGTADVTSYNIVYKYFGMLTMVFTIFLTPFWSASTEAYITGDIQWIRNGMRKYNQLNIVMFVVGVIMLLCSERIYRAWLGDNKIVVGFMLSLWGFIFFNVTMFGSKYIYFLNSISALRIQFWACVISPFIYIAVSMLLIKVYHLGVYSLFIASVVANFNAYFLAPLQYNMVINKQKKGIWTR